MPIFSYKAMDSSGKEISATIEAESLAQAKQKLYSSGIMLLSVKERKAQSSGGMGGVSFFPAKVSISELSLMTRQLATLIKARIPISESFTALIDQVSDPLLRDILSDVKKKINEGSSLAGALGNYPQIFDNVYVNMVEAGEASGTLHIVLIRLAEFTEGQSRLKNKVMGALTYPLFMAGAGLLVMVFIFVVIIPKITKVFKSVKAELPWATKVCVALSHFLKDYWWSLFIGIPFCAFVIMKYVKTKKGMRRWHWLQLRIPQLGGIVKMLDIGRFCSSLATLLNSGVPILTSLRIVKNLVSNSYIQDVVEQAREQVSEGGSMAGPLMNSDLFPPLVTHMIKLGEKSGEVESMLEIVAKNYDEQITTKLDSLTSILEPIIMLVLGGLVFFIVMAIVIPIMDLSNVRR